MIVNDGAEFSIGGKKSGITIRYRGNIRGFMILVRNQELSWLSYSRLNSLSWNNVIRLPFKRRPILF